MERISSKLEDFLKEVCEIYGFQLIEEYVSEYNSRQVIFGIALDGTLQDLVSALFDSLEPENVKFVRKELSQLMKIVREEVRENDRVYYFPGWQIRYIPEVIYCYDF